MECLNKILLVLSLVLMIFFMSDAITDDGILEEITSREEMVTWAGYGEEKLSTVTITGKIICRIILDRKSSENSIPVSGALVAISCGGNEESLVTGRSDSYGEFDIELPSNLHAIPSLEKMCHVKVYHVPRSSPCGEAFTGKNKAIRLSYTIEGIRSYHDGYYIFEPDPFENEIIDARYEQVPEFNELN